MAGKLTALELRSLLKNPGRYSDGRGLYFRTVGLGKAYFVFRFRVDGREREMSLGPYPEVSLAEARDLHAELKAKLRKGFDPFAERRAKIGNPPRKALTRAEAPDLTHLYRHYDFDGRLLYVGVSNNVIARWTRHKRQAPWIDLVANIRIDHYATREEAEDAEAVAILAEKPRFNGNVRINRQELRVARRSRRKVWPKPEPLAEPAP